MTTVDRLVAEFPATGGVVPSWSIQTAKLLRYVSPTDYFVLACEVFFILFIVYYIIEEIIEARLFVKCIQTYASSSSSAAAAAAPPPTPPPPPSSSSSSSSSSSLTAINQ